MGEEVKYPECEKLRKVSDKSNAIGEFIEWFQQKGDLNICRKYVEVDGLATFAQMLSHSWRRDFDPDEDEITVEQWHPYTPNIEDILAEFFNIDLKKLEDERRAMIEECRAS